MSKISSNSSLIFQVSLTEIMLLLVFILLMLSVVFQTRLNDYKDNNEKQISLLREYSKIINDNANLNRDLESNESNDVLEYTNTILDDLNNIITSKVDLKDDWAEFEIYREQIKKHKNMKGILNKFGETAKQLKQCGIETTRLKKRCGTGYPSCLKGKNKFIFDVSVYDDTAKLKYLSSVKEIPDDYLEKELSYIELATLFKKYYSWGMNQEIKCMFLVKVRNGTSDTDTWFSKEDIIDNYFYIKKLNLVLD